MNLVDISGLSPTFFILIAVFILFIVSMLGLGLLRAFQLQKRQSTIYFILGVIGIVAFAFVLPSLSV